MRALVFALVALLLPCSAWASDWDDCQAKGNPGLAIPGCTKVIKNAKETPKNRALAYYFRGLAQSAQGDVDAAIADYSAGLKLNPGHAETYNSRGAAYERNGDNGHALADYSKAIQLKPDYATAYNNRCWSYYLVGDFKHALPDCNKSLTLNPKNSHTLDSRCAVYVASKQYDRAIADCNNAIALDKNYGYAYFHRGDALYRKGQPGAALTDFKTAARLIPQSNAEYRAKAQSRISDIEAGKPAGSSP